jgi:hypothetical protein
MIDDTQPKLALTTYKTRAWQYAYVIVMVIVAKIAVDNSVEPLYWALLLAGWFYLYKRLSQVLHYTRDAIRLAYYRRKYRK